jgi:uncharacterized protein GlcG (DUF336 family)
MSPLLGPSRRSLRRGDRSGVGAEPGVDACRALGFNSSAVVVVGRGGDIIIAASDDNARPHAMEAARRKAYTSRTFAITTTDFSKELADRPARRAQVLLPNITSPDGGVPIKLGNDMIGGVGVAGSPRQGRAMRQGGAGRGESGA